MLWVSIVWLCHCHTPPPHPHDLGNQLTRVSHPGSPHPSLPLSLHYGNCNGNNNHVYPCCHGNASSIADETPMWWVWSLSFRAPLLKGYALLGGCALLKGCALLGGCALLKGYFIERKGCALLKGHALLGG